MSKRQTEFVEIIHDDDDNSNMFHYKITYIAQLNLDVSRPMHIFIKNPQTADGGIVHDGVYRRGDVYLGDYTIIDVTDSEAQIITMVWPEIREELIGGMMG